MFGAICGDIIGSPYEFNNTKEETFDLFTEKSHCTDDSVMTVAIAKSLLENGRDGTMASLEHVVAKNMRKLGLAHLDVGYGGRFRDWIEGKENDRYGSWGNGSGMRVSPVGWFYDSIEETLAAAKATAMPTHNAPDGIRGAQAVAACVFLARTGASKAEIEDYVTSTFYYDISHSIEDIRPSYSFDVSCSGSVPVAIRAFLESYGWEDCVRRAISVGGDSDTIGAMAGSIAEAYYGGVPVEIGRKCRELMPDDLAAVLGQWEDVISGRATPEETLGKNWHPQSFRNGPVPLPASRFAEPYWKNLGLGKGEYVAPYVSSIRDGEAGFGDDIENLVESLTQSGLIYHYAYRGYPRDEYWPNHTHGFGSLLRAVMNDPERFFIPEGYEQELSYQELNLVREWQKSLVMMKSNNASTPPCETPERAFEACMSACCHGNADGFEEKCYETGDAWYFVQHWETEEDYGKTKRWVYKVSKSAWRDIEETAGEERDKLPFDLDTAAPHEISELVRKQQEGAADAR